MTETSVQETAFEAVRDGDPKALDRALAEDPQAAGADPGTTSDDGKTAADFALVKGHEDLAERL